MSSAKHSSCLPDEKPSAIVTTRPESENVVPVSIKVDYSGAHEKTDPAEIALVKKLDRWIMPNLFLMYWLNYLDRNAIATARLNHLEKDLHLTSAQYQTCVSILFVGYLLGQIPSNMFLTRTRPSVYMSAAMMLWALISALTAASRNFTGLLLTRFFLGVAEAPFYPGAVYLLSVFYTRKEIASRIAILYTGNVLATAFAGLIAAGIFAGLDGACRLAGWQWLFIIQGAATFVVAAGAVFVLPDFPTTTRWLSATERELAHRRMQEDTVANEGVTSLWRGFGQAARDPMVWVFAAMAHMHLAANGFKNFFPTVVETLGFNQTVTLALTCPPYLIAAVVTILVSWSSGKMNERTWHITVSKGVATAGFIAACLTMNTAGRYVSMVVFTIGTYGVNSLILGWAGSVCGQTTEKKAVAIGIIGTIQNASFIWTPYLWPKSHGPRYVPALAASAGFSVATALLGWLAKCVMLKRNKELKEKEDGIVTLYVY